MKIGETFYAADIESNKWIDFLMLGVYTGKEYVLFRSVKDFLKWILHKRHDKVRIYFHNGGRFDFLFLLEDVLNSSRYHVSFVERQGRLLAFTVHGNGFRVQFADSYALLPSSLEKLIAAFKVRHKKIAVDFNKVRRFSDARLQSHLENDCRALYDILTEFRETTIDGEMKLTIASQALHLFRSKYFPSELVQMRAAQEDGFREKFYSGGRVEVFRAYGRNLRYYDVNSMYPYAMTFPMPVGQYKTVMRRDKSRIGFYEVRLRSNTDFFVSPLLKKTTLGNFYVNGIKGDTFYLSSAELDLLLESGVKVAIETGYEFQDSVPIFQDYVQDLFRLKQENAGNAKYTIYKLLANSLYGKLGSSRWVQQIQEYNGKQNDFEDFSIEHNLVLVWTRRKSKFILPYLAAYITSLARARHLRFLLNEPEKIYYCDTDSIITTGKLPTGEALGQLSLKGVYSEGVFLLPKSYALKDKSGAESVTLKGFNSSEFTFAQLKRSLETGRELKRKAVRMLSFRESLNRKNGIIRTRGVFLNLVEMVKKFDPRYTRRRLVPSKRHIYETAPFKTSELSL